MASNINCTLILPNEVRSDILTNLSDLAIYGVSIYNDIREIKEKDLSSSRVVVVGRVPLECLSDLKLFKYTLDLDMYFISNDELLCSVMSDFCKTFTVDYSKLDHSLLMSIFYEDSSVMSEYKVSYFSPSLSIDSIVERLLSEVDKDYVTLAKEYLNLRKALEKKEKESSLLKDNIISLESDLLGAHQTNETLMSELVSLISQYNTHYETLKDYKIMFTEDIYDTIILNNYKDRPNIIYFKEYTEFLHFESFIETLKVIFEFQMNSSVKVVRLHDSCDLHRIKILKDRYLTVDNKFLTSDVINNDFILCYGNYVKLFDVILSSRLDYLVVVDCKKFDNVVLIGDYLKLNLCRNPKDLEVLGLDSYNTIVNNNPDSIMSWDTYEKYNEFIEDIDRFTYLASRPVMQKLCELISII